MNKNDFALLQTLYGNQIFYEQILFSLLCLHETFYLHDLSNIFTRGFEVTMKNFCNVERGSIKNCGNDTSQMVQYFFLFPHVEKFECLENCKWKAFFNLAICIKSSHLYSNSDREGGRHGQYPIWRISNIPQIVIYAFCHTRGKTLILFRSWLTFTQCKIIFHGYSSVD